MSIKNRLLFSSSQQFHFYVKEIPPIPICLSLKIMVSWLTLSKAALKSSPIIHIPQPVSNDFCTAISTVKWASQVPGPLQTPNCKLGKRSLVSTNVLRHLAKRHSKVFDKTGVIGIGRYSLGIELGLHFLTRDLHYYISNRMQRSPF